MLDHELLHGFSIYSDKKFKLFQHFIMFMDHQNFLKKFIIKELSKVDNIVAISEYVKSKIINTYKINENKITVIYRGVDTKFFDPENIDEKQIC